MITLKNEKGITKEVKIGFSWTMLLFGAFVPLFRGDIKWFLISLILGMLTFGLTWLILPFFYNGVYLEELIEKGYKIIEEEL